MSPATRTDVPASTNLNGYSHLFTPASVAGQLRSSDACFHTGNADEKWDGSIITGSSSQQ